jgi:heme oxygenase
MTQRADPVTRVVGHITHEIRCTRAQVYKHRTKDLHDEFDKKIKEVMQPLHSRFHYFV